MRGYTTATCVLGYNLKLGRAYAFQLDFKIDNLFDYSEPLYVGTVQRPVGGNLSSPARVATPSNLYYLTPRNYTLSASPEVLTTSAMIRRSALRDFGLRGQKIATGPAKLFFRPEGDN